MKYDPILPDLYAREAERIRGVLGDRVVRLEHGGSTSVPGLPAKPVIDIVLELPDSSDEPVYVPDLEGAGFQARPGEQVAAACLAEAAVLDERLDRDRHELADRGGRVVPASGRVRGRG